MKTILAFLFAIGQCYLSTAQSVGIGTTTPHPSSSLDLGASAKPLIVPRLTTPQMNALFGSGAAQGMIVYNTSENQLYSYVKTGEVINIPINQWRPVSTGPRMLAWGVVDSMATIKSGSGNFSIGWDEEQKWFRLRIDYHLFVKDSMLLMVTPIGNGSWDQTVSIGQLDLSSTDQRASIKFTDVSRVASNWSALDTRRRSWFYFTLYDLRKAP